MAEIVLDSTGVPKSSLVEGAYEYCGLNGIEFERTPEEMTTGLRHLNALMAELLGDGVILGFDFPTYGAGTLEEPSGVPDHAVGAIHQLLGQRLAAAIGATLSPDAKAAMAKSYQGLRSRTAATPPRMQTSARMPSSGMRHGAWRLSPISSVVDPDDPGDLAEIIGV
jgi:hypothetical protein